MIVWRLEISHQFFPGRCVSVDFQHRMTEQVELFAWHGDIRAFERGLDVAQTDIFAKIEGDVRLILVLMDLQPAGRLREMADFR